MSLDIGWNASTLRGINGDGEGLVKQEDGKWTTRQTVEIDARYDSVRGFAEFTKGRKGGDMILDSSYRWFEM